MTEKLAGLVTPALGPLGYQQGLRTANIARIRKEIPDDVWGENIQMAEENYQSPQRTRLVKTEASWPAQFPGG